MYGLYYFVSDVEEKLITHALLAVVVGGGTRHSSHESGRRSSQQCIVVNSYRKTSGISRTKSQNLIVSCILLQLSSLNPLKPGVKLRMKM